MSEKYQDLDPGHKTEYLSVTFSTFDLASLFYLLKSLKLQIAMLKSIKVTLTYFVLCPGSKSHISSFRFETELSTLEISNLFSTDSLNR